MKYLYAQQPMPKNAKGVEVSLDTYDPNGNYVHIATVTSDASGMFKKMWTPEVPGEYTVIATFAGTNSYYGSSGETAVGVSKPSVSPVVTPTPTATQPPVTPVSPTPIQTPISPSPTQAVTPPTSAEPATTYIAIGVAVVVIVAVAAALLLRRRK
jgi:hypothetical protein